MRERDGGTDSLSFAIFSFQQTGHPSAPALDRAHQELNSFRATRLSTCSILAIGMGTSSLRIHFVEKPQTNHFLIRAITFPGRSRGRNRKSLPKSLHAPARLFATPHSTAPSPPSKSLRQLFGGCWSFPYSEIELSMQEWIV
jgi:hypothetical protein